MGIEGSAWGTTVPHLLACIFIIGYVLRLLRMPVRRYFNRAWRTPLMVAMPPRLHLVAAECERPGLDLVQTFQSQASPDSCPTRQLSPPSNGGRGDSA